MPDLRLYDAASTLSHLLKFFNTDFFADWKCIENICGPKKDPRHIMPIGKSSLLTYLQFLFFPIRNGFHQVVQNMPSQVGGLPI